jgi:hypothetical protein
VIFMGYEIEKFNRKGEGASAAGSKIDDALNRLRQGREAPASHGPEKATAAGNSRAAAAAAIVELPRYCARHDKPYVAVFVRGANGLFRFKTSVKEKAESSPWMAENGVEALNDKQRESAERSYQAWSGDKGKFDFGDYVAFVQKKWRANNSGSARDENRVTLDGKDIDSSGAPESCAYCGAKSVVRCGACELWVCRGRTQGNYFRCRPGCGAAGDIDGRPLPMEGTVRKDANPHGAASGGAPEKRGGQAAGAAKRLLLGSGSAPVRGGNDGLG